ncbi:hydrogenase maturation protein [Streptomyces glaucosporus]|uniref:Hydrogenase maturation protein n=1 Tax=Streptomyces glaucosporus TaxID=284044 RepID=A0ABP5V332_9ACTN
MRILLVASAFNSLTQRVLVELEERGHAVSVELVPGDGSGWGAVERHAPDLVLVPTPTAAVPRKVWSARTCLVVHPGPPGDRGPSSLDRALQDGAGQWGVTVFQAGEEPDTGPVWASAPFSVPQQVGKSDLYRGEVADAAVEAVLLAVRRFASGAYTPRPRPEDGPGPRPCLGQEERRIDWENEPTRVVLRKLRAADSRPGVLDEFAGGEWYLHGGHYEDRLRGRPGEVLATRCGAICRATTDGAVWIPRLRPRPRPGGPGTFTLPAALALGDRLRGVPEAPVPLWLPAGRLTWSEIRYEESGPVGFVRFSFPGGATGTDRCRRLLDAYRFACSRPTQVVVLGACRDFFSNGIDLNLIEAADDPAEEAWANLHAMDDLVEAVLTTTDRLVVSALGGNASAGGAMLALAADEVWCRTGTVLNPHYRLMGLYGSEYWTYTLPRRVGAEEAERLTRQALPVGATAALRTGLVDRVLSVAPENFFREVARMAVGLAADPSLQTRIGEKKVARERDEAVRPLRDHRATELARTHRCLFRAGEPHHALRSAFVRGEGPARTPEHLTEALPRRRTFEL